MRRAAKRRLIEARKAAREGKRFAAFYRGCKDRRAGRMVNPYAPGSEEARCWQAGYEYVEGER
jgi:hypothetical protein